MLHNVLEENYLINHIRCHITPFKKNTSFEEGFLLIFSLCLKKNQKNIAIVMTFVVVVFQIIGAPQVFLLSL